jgi:hypothetical protein
LSLRTRTLNTHGEVRRFASIFKQRFDETHLPAKRPTKALVPAPAQRTPHFACAFGNDCIGAHQ